MLSGRANLALSLLNILQTNMKMFMIPLLHFLDSVDDMKHLTQAKRNSHLLKFDRYNMAVANGCCRFEGLHCEPNELSWLDG